MIEVTLLIEDAVMPTRATDGAAGFDLYAAHSQAVHPRQWAMVNTGVAVGFPPGWHGQVRPRSGLAVRQGIDVLAGTIDRDFRGGIGVVLMNNGSNPFQVEPGDRIAQLVPTYDGALDMKLVERLGETERDNRGFGSTGK